MAANKTEIPEYQIIKIHMELRQTRIAEIMYKTEDTSPEEKTVPTEEAINMMKNEKCKFYTLDDKNGQKSYVDIIDSYIRAKGDDTQGNTLKKLPQF